MRIAEDFGVWGIKEVVFDRVMVSVLDQPLSWNVRFTLHFTFDFSFGFFIWGRSRNFFFNHFFFVLRRVSRVIKQLHYYLLQLRWTRSVETAKRNGLTDNPEIDTASSLPASAQEDSEHECSPHPHVDFPTCPCS